MLRIAIAVVALVVLVNPVPAEQPALRDALVLQQAMEAAIAAVEPNVACLLVSRSDGYRRLFDDTPPKDNPGKLGIYRPAPITTPFGQPGTGEDIRSLEIKRLDLADPTNVPESFGSGIVIGEANGAERGLLVLTNYHVIRGATKIYVRLSGDKGSYADIHAADPRSDLAVLRLLSADLPRVKAPKFGDGGALRKGQWVLSVAHPFAAGFRDGSPSASWGIVSNLRRRPVSAVTNEFDRSRTLQQYGTLIQTDARLNLGCSGGALVNLRGELVGLTTSHAAISGGESAGGFAVPFDDGQRRIVERLSEGLEVEYGFLGVQLSSAGWRGPGVQISDVIYGSPAHSAGLRKMSVILSVNGQRVRDHDDLFLVIGTTLAGNEVRIEYTSPAGTDRQVGTARLMKFHTPGPILAARRPEFRGLRVDWTSIVTQPFPQAIPEGVIVAEIRAGTPAANAHLRSNEIITHVNGVAVLNPAEFYREANKAREAVELTLKSSHKVTLTR
jgi:S1-C subfamily serine protease